MPIQNIAINNDRYAFSYSPSTNTNAHQNVIDYVKHLLSENNLDIAQGQSLGLSLDDAGQLQIIGDIKNKDEIQALLADDKKLMAMLGQIKNQTPPPADQKTSDVKDIVELSEQARQNYETMRADLKIDETHLINLPADDAKSDTDIWSDPARISRLLGLKSAVQNKNDLVDLLRIVVNQKTTTLQEKLSSLLENHAIKLSEDEKIEIEFNDQGEIVVSGLEDKQKAQKIADILNKDETFARDLASLRAHRNIYEYNLSLAMGETGATPPPMADRKILLEEVLARDNIELSKISIENDQITSSDPAQNEILQNIIKNDPFLAQELNTVLQADPETLQSTLKYSFQNATLVDEFSENKKVLAEGVHGLGTAAFADHPSAKTLLGNDLLQDPGALHKYNESVHNAPDKRIVGFDFAMSDSGTFDIIGKFANGDDLDRNAQNMIKSWFSEEFVNNVEYLSDSMMRRHQGEHGDVDDYEHNIVFHTNSYAGITADIFSEEADQAALAQIDDQSALLNQAIDSYFEEYDIELTEPVDIEITSYGRFKVADTYADNPAAAPVEQVVTMLNMAIRLDTDSILPDSLKSAMAPLREIRDLLLNKIHNDKNRHSVFTVGAREKIAPQ